MMDLNKIVVLRKNGKSYFRGLAINLLGVLFYNTRGVLSFDKQLNCWAFTPSWNVICLGENTISAINKEIEYLKKKKKWDHFVTFARN